MKKRILASTMASVMALSAVGTSLISSAAVADYKQETITKAELKAFLADKEIKDLADGDIDNYGSVSGERFMTAYQYAQAVVDDSETDDDDCTAAFQMIKAAKDQLHTYDAKALLALVEEYRRDYNTENLLSPNSDSDDVIYDPDTWTDFAGAFEEAEGYTSYTGDIRITTDAYEVLEDTHGKLKTLTVKTKRQIDAARQAYEKALDLEFKYQPWQRGTIKDADGAYNKDVSWGAIYAHIASGEASVKARYDDFAAIKGLTKTSNTDIVAAVEAMEMATKVLNGFTPTAMESGNQRKVTTLISQYQGRLVFNYNSDLAEEVFDSFCTVATNKPEVKKGSNAWDNADPKGEKEDKWDYEMSDSTDFKALDVKTATTEKVLYAEMAVRSAEDKIYYVVDTDVTLLNGKNPIVKVPGTDEYFTKSEPTGLASKYKTFSATKNREIVISDLIPVGTDEIAASAVGNNAAVTAAKAEWDAAKAATQDAVDAIYKGATTEAAESGALANAEANVAALVSALDAINITALTTNALKTAIDNAITAAKNGASAVADAITLAKDDPRDAALVEAVDTKSGDIAALLTAITTAITNYNTDDMTNNAGANQCTTTVPSYTAVSTSTLRTTLSNAIDNEETKKNAYDDAVDAAGNVAGTKNNAWNNYFDLPGEVTSFSKGLCADKFKDAGIIFDIEADYTSSAENSDTGNWSSETAVSLYDALEMIEKFNADVNTPRVGDWVDIINWDNINEIVAPDGEKAPSSPAWKLLYNYLKYALEDEFDAKATTTHTKAEVEKLLSDAYQLVSDTVETSMFATSNGDLVDARTDAAEWIKLANNDRRNYKDNVSSYNGQTSTDIYNKLNTAYKQLKAERDGFKYSYGEIVDKMADAAELIDSDKLSGTAKDNVKKALADVALGMTKVQALVDSNGEFEESTPFNDDGSLNVYNRVLSSSKVTIKTPSDRTFENKNDNARHTELTKFVEALDKAVEDATKVPEKDPLDIDGNGTVALADVTEMLKLYSNGKCDVAKHDFNKNEKIDLGDVTEMLKQYSNK